MYVDLTKLIWAFVLAMGIPSGITSFCFWLFQKKLEKNEKAREAKEKKLEDKEKIREQQEFLIVKGIGAAISLGEATAEAIARIPDAHCNGDMHKALEYARKVKHEQKEFLQKQGIEAIY